MHELAAPVQTAKPNGVLSHEREANHQGSNDGLSTYVFLN
jgi:hypothetical protein